MFRQRVLRAVNGNMGETRQHLRHLSMLRTEGLLADSEYPQEHGFGLVELALEAMEIGQRENCNRRHWMVIAGQSCCFRNQLLAEWDGLSIAVRF